MTEQPALGSTTYTIDEILHTFDDIGKITSASNDSVCVDLTSKIYALPDGGYRTYKYHISSSGISDASSCDTIPNATTTYCVSQILVRYGSFVVSSMESKHGMEKKDMLIEIGAIVGAVAYVASYFTFFQLG